MRRIVTLLTLLLCVAACAAEPVQMKVFDRGIETWQPDPSSLSFDWARKLTDGPIRTTLFTNRSGAWETMELARRLDLQVHHLYWDGSGSLSGADWWPYRATTGQSAIPLDLASQRAVELASDDRVELFLVTGVSAKALPGDAQEQLLKRVAAGRGLLLADPPGQLEGWPQDLLQSPDPEATRQLLDGLEWEHIPGYSASSPPATAYRYGQGRVVVLSVSAGSFGTLVPAHNESEGLVGVTDHALALAARCALVAANRPLLQTHLLRATDSPTLLRLQTDPPPPADSMAVVRITDDLDNVVAQQTFELPLDGNLPLPRLPALRRHWIDAVVRDSAGHCLGFSFLQQPAVPQPEIDRITLTPAIQKEDVRICRVDLPGGGEVTAGAQIVGLTDAAELDWEVRDTVGRLVARATSPVSAAGGSVSAVLTLPRPVTVCHYMDLTLRQGEHLLARQRHRFTMTMPYPYDDFTALLWSFAYGDPVLRITDRKCYEWGADMMDLYFMGGFEGDKAAQAYWLRASSGLRLIPYVARLAGGGDGTGAVARVPCLHDPAYLESTQRDLLASCCQAEPFCPPAYTLGDENYLYMGAGEPCNTPQTMAAFRQWLQAKYGSIAALNAAWATQLTDFEAITQPMVFAEALKQTESFAPWLDHRLFMETAFAATHELFMDTIRTVDPKAKAGWDGLHGWWPHLGYDFRKLTARLQLNQTYIEDWLACEMVRSFKRPDALTGKWGNVVADVEAGWHAFPWDCLLSGNNSVWWWESWGCDYIPFNPDTSQSNFGKWFFESLREITAGAGKLLLQAEPVDSGVAVLHAQRNMFAGRLLAGLEGQASRAGAGDGGYLHELRILLLGLRGCGISYRVIAPEQLSGPQNVLDTCKVLFVPLAVCLSDAEADVLREFVRRGGTLVVDGRCGLLDGDGHVRQQRPLDDVLGVRSPSGLESLQAASPVVDVELAGVLEGVAKSVPLRVEKFQTRVFEPGLAPTTAQGLVEGQPLLLTHRFGQGVAVTLNLDSSDGNPNTAPLGALGHERTKPGQQPYEAILAALLQAAGVPPFCDLKTESGDSPLCVQQVFYRDRDGDARYLALMRDILVRGLPAEEAQVTLREPAYVYDLRAGKLLGQGQLQTWTVRLDRGFPAVYALLPYTVTGVEAAAPTTAQPGKSTTVQAEVKASTGQAGTHVIRLDVFAPDATTPHRQYSQNLLCRRGPGCADLPFALNDPSGQWRLVFRDAATGVQTARTLTLE